MANVISGPRGKVTEADRDATLARIRLSVLLEDLAECDLVVEAVKSQGYRYVTLDLEGFRSGNLNG